LSRVNARLLLSASCCTALVFCWAVPARTDDEAPFDAVVVKVLPSSDRARNQAIVEKVAAASDPELVDVPPGSCLADVVRQRCGNSSEPLMRVMRRLNPGVDAYRPAAVAVQVRLASCPYWELGPQVRVDSPGKEGAGRAMDALMGYSGPVTQAKVLEANPSLNGDLGNLGAGDQMTLPWATRPVTVPLRPDLADKAAVAAGILKTTGALSVRPPELTQGLDLVRDVEVASTDDDGGCPGLKEAGSSWPFPRDAVLDVLTRNGKVGQVRALIADTGIGRDDVSRLPLYDNAEESGASEDDGIDEDGSGYPDDRWGATLYPPFGFPGIQTEYPRFAHGVNVATVLAGTGVADALSAAIRDRVRLSIGNVVKVRKTAAATEFSIDPAGVEESVRLAAALGAFILNWSLEGPQEMKGVLEALKKNERLLVVAAAGNDGQELKEAVGFPWGYVVDIPDRMLIVAAHDPKGKRASFSNYGKAIVDIAAPGCGVPTQNPGGARTAVQGTSFAAPLVALTAALLASEGLERPQAIKRRILATARLDDGLAEAVTSSGTLDIPKALAIRDDILEVEGDADKRKLLMGRIVEEPAQWSLCGRQVAAKDIVRLIPERRAGDPRPTLVRLRRYNARGYVAGVTDEYCTTPDVAIKFKSVGESEPRSFALKDLRDYIPSLLPPLQ
jgi:subtilisin family serine protease